MPNGTSDEYLEEEQEAHAETLIALEELIACFRLYYSLSKHEPMFPKYEDEYRFVEKKIKKICDCP